MAYELTAEDLTLLRKLRNEGWAVVLFTPEELEDTAPTDVEDRMIERGWDVIDYSKQTPAQETEIKQ